jgi:CBS domain-containing protein
VNGTVGSILGRKGREIWSLAPDATVYDAIALMAAKSVGALLVIAEGSLLGIVSEVDFGRRVILQGRSSKKIPVREIMTSNPITAAPEDTVDECLKIMTYTRIRHLPVLEGLELVGIVSMGDLVNSIIGDQTDTIDELHRTWGEVPG